MVFARRARRAAAALVLSTVALSARDAAASHGGESNVTEPVHDFAVVYGWDGVKQEHGQHLCLHGIGAAWYGQPKFLDHIRGPHPKVYTLAMPASTIAMLATLVIAVPHMKEVFRRVPSERQRRARRLRVVACVPLAICIVKFLAVFLPRDWKIFFLAAAVFEVVAFWNFMSLILSMVTESEVWTDKDVIQHLPEEVKMWAVVPLACCFKPCCTERVVRKRDFHIQRLLMWQFIIVAPLVSVLEWSELEAIEPWHKQLSRFETASLILAMYGLFALLNATHQKLHDRNCHAKFWTIKGVFIANTAIFRACSAKMTYDVRIGDVCYSAGAMASAWAAMWTALLCVPLAYLSRRAYIYSDMVFDLPKGEGQDSSEGSEGSDEESVE